MWIPLAVGLTGVFGFAYLVGQQGYRQSMNDPQIQMAEDAAGSLSRDNTPANVVPRGVASINIANDLAPWITVYDASGTPLESDAVLDGAPPRMPAGLLDTSTWSAQKTWQSPFGLETRVTWQPRPNIRQAVVLVQFAPPYGKEGFVAVGRSMSAIEERIINLTELAAVAWGATIIATFAAIFILVFLGLL